GLYSLGWRRVGVCPSFGSGPHCAHSASTDKEAVFAGRCTPGRPDKELSKGPVLAPSGSRTLLLDGTDGGLVDGSFGLATSASKRRGICRQDCGVAVGTRPRSIEPNRADRSYGFGSSITSRPRCAPL